MGEGNPTPLEPLQAVPHFASTPVSFEREGPKGAVLPKKREGPKGAVLPKKREGPKGAVLPKKRAWVFYSGVPVT